MAVKRTPEETRELIQRLLSAERAQELDTFAIMTFFPLEPDQHVADIGAGPGFFSIPLAKHLIYGKLYALDSDEEMLKVLRQRVAEEIIAASRAIHLYPGVLSTLARLRRLGIMTGVITNTFQSSAEKWRWFTEHGLAPYLDRILSSSEVGLVKPDPAIYQLYVAECGLCPEEVAFVGHDLEELEGARAAGLLALAFRPDRSGVFQPEFYDFPALLPLIGAVEG